MHSIHEGVATKERNLEVGHCNIIALINTRKGADFSAPFPARTQVRKRVQTYFGADESADRLNSEYISFPTKPNFVTPDALMMFSTWAESS